MAWYYGTFSCGCEGRVNIIGPTKDRQWKADRKFEGLCPECWEKHLQEERERKNKEATEKAKEMELPTLIGTEKQVAWANTLRQKLIEKIDAIDAEMLKEAKREYEELENISLDEIKLVEEYILKNRVEARYFIDNRYTNAFEFIKRDVKEVFKTDEEKLEEKIFEDIKLESTVFPENQITNVAAEIIVNDDEIKVIFEKNDKFIEVVKGLRYKWDGIWKRKISFLTGNAEDRAAELGNKLLNAGFPICILNETIRNNAVNGVYEPECDRWISFRTHGDYKGWITVRWYDNSDLYNKARKLPGSKWSNPSVVVRLAHYKEVEEFARLYDFKFSPGVVEAIEEYKESLKGVNVVIPEKVEKQEQKDGLEEILNSSTDVLDDLREED